MKRFIEPAREIPVVKEAEVLVIGGGPAGPSAALCVEHDQTPRKLDPRLLREALAADGVKVECPELKPQ